MAAWNFRPTKSVPAPKIEGTRKGFVGFRPDPKVQAHGDGSGKHPIGWWVRKFKPSPDRFWERIRLLTEGYL